MMPGKNNSKYIGSPRKFQWQMMTNSFPKRKNEAKQGYFTWPRLEINWSFLKFQLKMRSNS